MQRKSLLIGAGVLGTFLLACAQPVSAQSPKARADDIHWTHPATPVCVYKAVMSDTEIQACTGHPVHYDYRIYYDEGISP